MRLLQTVVFTALLIAGLAAGYQMLRERVAQNVYRKRLVALSHDYEQLRDRYNEAVRKSAVTELLVEHGKLSVVVMSSAGELRRIPTPYDPSQEIHVDFVVLNGRLWIRRVHDDATPATQALTIDPKLASVDWDKNGQVYGISIYRPLSEGRWVVRTTSNGALTLVRTEEGADIQLFEAPEVRDFGPIEQAVKRDIAAISARDVLSSLQH